MFDETPTDAWRMRYGADAPELPDLGRFLDHRSIRHFRPEPIPESTVAGLIAAAQSAATSSNLQLWSAVSVQNKERRAKIAHLCADQQHVRDAAWFFAFLIDHNRLRIAARAVGEEARGLDYTEFFVMALIDAALAAERLVCAAESLGIGICYIGALRNHPAEVTELLELPEGVFGAFGLCLGWPEQSLREDVKPRLPQEAVWFRERYGAGLSLGDYDQRMDAHYAERGLKPGVNWSMRSGKRVDEGHLTGREVLMEWLQGRGFMRR
ncbi:MAG: nitroreductase family protein [Fimbriimonas ginsengisoli]|uniref:Nitroreductase family protein n=1 Tax=Fimbriimonas ginsengisoli TaxID=1005039 RepID=A0A931LXF8_FIMGI|nr:nitroreductase family protein [Fimbriimonas ginsengisoli]